MERSDPTRRAAADPASVKAEPASPAAHGAPVPDGAASDHVLPPASEPEPIILETVSFEPVEREEDTTQPVRRSEASDECPAHKVTAEPQPVSHGAMPADVAPPPEVAPPAGAPAELPSPPAYLWDDVPEDVLEPTWPLRRGLASEELPADVAPQAEPPSTLTVSNDLPSESYTPAAPPLPSDRVPVEPTPIERLAAEPIAVEPISVAPSPIDFGPPAEPEAIPPPPTPSPAFTADYGAAAPLAWNPAADSIAPPAPVPAPDRAPARDTTRLKDLALRALRVAAIVFGAWVSAVLFLIVVFRFVNPPASTLMALQWISGTPIQHEWVPLERISPNLIRAVIVAEDGRFCEHWGIDFVEMAKAIERANDGYPRGASTITMQVAKNLFLLPVKSYLRKVVEVPLTFAIELAWPKWRILEVYLNIAEWGPGIFGAEAASRAHFGRSAAGLSARQAAQLAVVLPNPIVRDAGSPGPRTAHRASIIQARAARTSEASACVAP